MIMMGVAQLERGAFGDGHTQGSDGEPDGIFIRVRHVPIGPSMWRTSFFFDRTARHGPILVSSCKMDYRPRVRALTFARRVRYPLVGNIASRFRVSIRVIEPVAYECRALMPKNLI